MFRNQELNKSDTEQMNKIDERNKENALRIAEGKEPKKQLKFPELGDWQCDLCSYKNVCYDQNKKPRDF